MTVVGNRDKDKRKSDHSNDNRSSRHDNDNNESTGTNNTTESIPKSLVIVWILMAAELGFDLIATGIAFFLSCMVGETYCCGLRVSKGPLPMTATILFFLLIVAEITFLGRAILLTLWPSIFESETSRIATHGSTGTDNVDDDDDQQDQDQVGFDVTIKKNDDDDNNNNNNNNNDDEGGNKATTTALSSSKQDGSVKELHKDEIPEFIIDGNDRNSSKKKGRTGCLKFFCSCFLRWNAKMVLGILNLLTLLNPFFYCLIVWILLYQFRKTEAVIVLGIELLSIILHFISVRMEGGLRTWYSKLLHSIAILQFLVSVALVLVYFREGGVCYSFEKERFSFSGCEFCPDTFLPPDMNGMCIGSTGDDSGGNYTSSSTYSLAGSGGFLQDIQNLITGGAYQYTYCSADTNFCFYDVH